MSWPSSSAPMPTRQPAGNATQLTASYQLRQGGTHQNRHSPSSITGCARIARGHRCSATRRWYHLRTVSGFSRADRFTQVARPPTGRAWCKSLLLWWRASHMVDVHVMCSERDQHARCCHQLLARRQEMRHAAPAGTPSPSHLAQKVPHNTPELSKPTLRSTEHERATRSHTRQCRGRSGHNHVRLSARNAWQKYNSMFCFSKSVCVPPARAPRN